MGQIKNAYDAYNEAKRYNAAVKKQEKLLGKSTSRLIRIETFSEIERYSMAQDAKRVTEYNNAVIAWQNSVSMQLRAGVISRSMRVARELIPKAYTDDYGIINRLGFSFPRHGIYIHKGAGKGYGGLIGSKWTKLKKINGIEFDTGIVRHTNPVSKGKLGTGSRNAFEWFDPVIKNRLPELSDIVLRYFDTMLIDATRIFIDK